QCIGATTLDEYRQYIEKDGALERRFQKVLIDPPSVVQTLKILKGLQDRYEKYHRIRYTDKAIDSAVKLSDRYIIDKFLPDKAIDVMDESGSKVHLANISVPREIVMLEERLRVISQEKNNVIKNQEFEKAAVLRDREKRLLQDLSKAKERWEKDEEEVLAYVTEEDIAQVVSMMSGVPVSKVAQSESEKLLKMSDIIKESVIGQDQVIESLAKAIRRTRAGLKDPRSPIGSFIFLGPTGVGKTYLAQVLAEYLFQDENALIRVDMSEFMEKFSVSRMTGAPPGYVGYEEGGQLTEKVRKHPYSVILFDEIEKAHPDVFNVLLQILDEGHLTDGLGRKVDFRNTVLILTSNLGSRSILDKGYGFGKIEGQVDYKTMKSTMMEETKKLFTPEFLNRIDEIMVFRPLSKKDITKIIDIAINELLKISEERNITIKLTENAKKYLIDKGFEPKYGARQIKRVLRRYVVDPIAEQLLKGKFSDGSRIQVTKKGNKLEFSQLEEKQKKKGSEIHPEEIDHKKSHLN
ncbi:MAG: ATP-dependent Clp protease ATP-binding subunit, partial [bacterium]